jgi:lactate racemase
MIVNLPYGKSHLPVDVPEWATVLQSKQIPELKNAKAAALEALSNPIGSPPLKELVKSRDKVAIVISDITRPTPNHLIIPWLLEELAAVPLDNITIINGTGSHRENTEEELTAMLGQQVMESVRVINHSAFKAEELVYLGNSSTGGEVFLNKTYCEADVKIGTGFIEPHFFAGFSGGPKSIMPGVAGLDSIMHFHSAALIGDPNSTWGLIDENPIQQEASEIALMAKPDFSFNVTLNSQKEITGIFAGDLIEAHRQGAAAVKEQTMIPCPQPFDIVLTTNSGYPLDQNLYQAVKGMSAAHQIVKEGGCIICAAECSEGIPAHGNFGEILQMGDNPDHLLDIINDPEFSMFDQWEAQKMAIIQTWADIYLYSNLSPELVEMAQLSPVSDISKTLDQLIASMGPETSIAVLAEGPLTIPFIKVDI